MRKSDNQRPHNWCVINVQLDERRARVFHRMKDACGLTVTEILKSILNPIIDRFEAETADAERMTAAAIIGLRGREEKA